MNHASGVDPNEVVRVRHASAKRLDRQHATRLPAGTPGPLDGFGWRRPPTEVACLAGRRGGIGHGEQHGAASADVNCHA
jgi:hypothetical protein